MSDDNVNQADLVGRSWSAYSAMLNEARALESAAQRLRERAEELHFCLRFLDPPTEEDIPSTPEAGAYGGGYNPYNP